MRSPFSSGPAVGRLFLSLAIVSIGLLSPSRVRGDAGPPPLRPTNPTRIDVTITLEGIGVEGSTWLGVLLVPAGDAPIQIAGKELPDWLTPQLLTDASGHHWLPLLAPKPLEEGHLIVGFPGRTQGNPKHRMRFPAQFRLAAANSTTGKVYITEPAETRTHNANFFTAQLRPDGGGSLELVPLSSPAVLYALGGPFLVALGLTLLTELVIAAAWVALVRPGGERPFGRVLLTTVAANLITVPLLFWVGVFVKMEVPEEVISAFWAVLLGGPLVVIAVEALLYVVWGRLSAKQASWLSVVANLCTVVFCCGGVWAYGW